MRKVLFLLTILVILLLFPIDVGAEESIDEYISEFESVLPEELGGGFSDSDGLIDRIGLSSLISEMVDAINGRRGEIITFFCSLVGLTLLTAVSSLLSGEVGRSVSISVGIVCSVGVFRCIEPLFSSVTESLDDLSSFFGSLIPITAGITALGGGVNAASVQAGGMYLTLSLVGGVGGEVLSSMSILCVSLALMSSVGGNATSSVSRGLKSLFSWLMGIFTALTTAAFSLQSLVASTADSATIRAAKYMASGLLPIVGSTVSGALSTLAGGLNYAKGVVGGGAICAMLLMLLPTLAILLCYRLSLSLAIMLSDMIGGMTSMLTSYRNALDTLIAIYALSAVIYLFEIIVFIKLAVAVG